MSKCEFLFSIELLPKFIAVSEKIPARKGSFSGNEQSGDFRIFTLLGDIVGDYVCDNKYIRVYIRAKPMLIPCTIIEKELGKLLAEVS